MEIGSPDVFFFFFESSILSSIFTGEIYVQNFYSTFLDTLPDKSNNM